MFPGSCPKSHLSHGFTNKYRCPAKLLWAQLPRQEGRIKIPELKDIRLQKQALSRLEMQKVSNVRTEVPVKLLPPLP